MRGRREDSDETHRHYRYVDYVKASLGLVFGVGAVLMGIVPSETAVDHGHTLHVGQTLILALMCGLMIDAPGVTRLASVVIDAVPFSPRRSAPPATIEEKEEKDD